MIAPYEGEPENLGIVVTDKEEMVELVSRASANGFASTIHAIGDRAVHDVLDVYEQVRREEAERGEPRSTRRHRIEHVQLIHPDDVNRLAELDIIASMQPIHATSDYLMADRYWGERALYSYNPRLQLDRGVMVAFGSDTPVEPMGSLIGIHAAVTRQRADGSPAGGWNPAARLTVDEALRGYTLGPAYAAGMDDRLGKTRARLSRRSGRARPRFVRDIARRNPRHQSRRDDGRRSVALGRICGIIHQHSAYQRSALSLSSRLGRSLIAES